MSYNYFKIQQEVINKYKIVIIENSICRTRTHAHCDGTRRICKWIPKNSIQATFELFHEVGHIMTYTSKMRRVESEYYATIWAMERFKEYNLEVPTLLLKKYQNYIDRELSRGLRRGGNNYRDSYNLNEYKSNEIIELSVKEPKPIKVRKRRIL